MNYKEQKKGKFFLKTIFFFTLITLFPLSTYAQIGNAQDPYERFNRAMFSFNDTLDVYLLKPITILYNKILPKPLNQGIHNFFNNIDSLCVIANDILQFNFYQMGSDVWRLGINTTIGIGGFFDVASRLGLKPYNNDFGLTLAKWGWKNSNFIVLPFFGPYTIRDTFSIPVDYYAFSVYPYIHPKSVRYGLYGLGVIDHRSQLMQFQAVMEEVAFDKYSFVRNAYLQRRAHQIEQQEQPITVNETNGRYHNRGLLYLKSATVVNHDNG